MVLVKDFYFLKELEKEEKNTVWRKILWKFEKENKLKRNIYLFKVDFCGKLWQEKNPFIYLD